MAVRQEDLTQPSHAFIANRESLKPAELKPEGILRVNIPNRIVQIVGNAPRQYTEKSFNWKLLQPFLFMPNEPYSVQALQDFLNGVGIHSSPSAIHRGIAAIRDELGAYYLLKNLGKRGNSLYILNATIEPLKIADLPPRPINIPWQIADSPNGKANQLIDRPQPEPKPAKPVLPKPATRNPRAWTANLDKRTPENGAKPKTSESIPAKPERIVYTRESQPRKIPASIENRFYELTETEPIRNWAALNRELTPEIVEEMQFGMAYDIQVYLLEDQLSDFPSDINIVLRRVKPLMRSIEAVTDGLTDEQKRQFVVEGALLELIDIWIQAEGRHTSPAISHMKQHLLSKAIEYCNDIKAQGKSLSDVVSQVITHFSPRKNSGQT